MTNPLETRLVESIGQFKKEGVYKRLNYLEGPQAARVHMEGRGEVIILSSNNYLGLSAEPSVIAAGQDALERYGAGTLTNAELLAILLRVGSTRENVLELAARLLPDRPEMKVLYMSGYADDTKIQHGLSNQDIEFLPKPFTPDDLAWKVRQVLDKALLVTPSTGLAGFENLDRISH